MIIPYAAGLCKGFGEGLADIFAAKPTVEVDQGMFIFIPGLKVVLINPAALF